MVVLAGISSTVCLEKRKDGMVQVIGGAERCAHFSYFGAGQIAPKFGVWLPGCFTKAKSGVQLHLRACAPLFCISGMPGRIELKFCLWLGDH